MWLYLPCCMAPMAWGWRVNILAISVMPKMQIKGYYRNLFKKIKLKKTHKNLLSKSNRFTMQIALNLILKVT